MFISPYRTSVTRAHQDEGKRIAPDLTNRKALEAPMRRDAWLKKQAS